MSALSPLSDMCHRIRLRRNFLVRRCEPTASSQRQPSPLPCTRSSSSPIRRAQRLQSRSTVPAPRRRQLPSRRIRLPHLHPRRRPHASMTIVRVAAAVVVTADVAGYHPADRDRALRRVGSWTVSGVSGVVAATGALSAVSAAGFVAATSSVPVQHVPHVPVEAAPVQRSRPTPAVIVKVVHVPGAPSSVGRSRGSTVISPPRRPPTGSSPGSQANPPAPPPPPPPPPVCHSTPTHPC